MDHLDPWRGVDREVVAAMSADIDAYCMALDCKCEGLCTCDDTVALSAAQQMVDIRT